MKISMSKAIGLFVFSLLLTASVRAQGYTLEQIRSYSFPTGMTAAATGSRLAWVFNEQGRRNVWVAEGPEFRARRLTNYTADDGQELSSLSLSADGKWVVYVRGGDSGANWEDAPPNPLSNPVGVKKQIWSVPFAGGGPKALAEADEPAISPRSDVVAFVRSNAIWVARLDGSTPAKQMFAARGNSGSPVWSPDGSRLAFVSGRGDHAFIGIYTDDATPILWLQPSTSRDGSPRWSPDGKRVAFVRRPGAGGSPQTILDLHPSPWSIWTADAATGEGQRIWKSGNTLRDSAPTTHGGTNLHWAALGRIVFASYQGGWPHLYSIAETGGEPLLLTPGNYMAEHIQIAPDGRSMIFTANAGSDANDIDRRHLVRAPVDKTAPQVLTPGDGGEWSPAVAGDGTVAFLSSAPNRPPLPAVLTEGGQPRLLAADTLPANYPSAQLVTPKKAVYKAPDGVQVHGQLFEKPGGAAKKPAVIYVHGGPPRQMLLGWHYSEYYSNAYALNQYLASRGYVVLSVNFRLGIGYGYEFHNPSNAGFRGASEYQDVKAGGEYLRSLPQVDAKRIGIYGGSYGGFLTAMALARDSALFAAGVDWHGVHDWTKERARGFLARDSYEPLPDGEKALTVAWQSSPISSMSTWKSPVLLIHGDDDRNVRFNQTTDLARRLDQAGVEFEELVLPDEIHGFARHASWLKVNEATARYFDRKFGVGPR